MHQPAAVQDTDAIADALDLGEDVRGKDDGLTAHGGGPQLREQFVAHRRVERVGRLVENDERHARGEHGQERDLALHARRQLRERARQIDIELLGQAIDIAIDRHAAQVGEKVHKLPARHVFVEPQFAGQISGLAADRDAVRPAIVSGDRTLFLPSA